MFYPTYFMSKFNLAKTVKEVFELLQIQPISCHWCFFIPPENIRKLLVFGSFSGDIERDRWYEMG